MQDPILNKVAESSLITVDPADYYPKDDIKLFDLKDFLFMGLILKEKDFREALKGFEWSPFKDQYVAVTCSADAIIPVWAWMLVGSYLQPVARKMFMGTAAEVHKQIFLENLSHIDVSSFSDKRIVVKGCGDTPIGDFVYMELTRLLQPVVKSIMYGEPCSTVPVYKKK